MSTNIKGYEVHEKLGSGAFGDVYRATSPAPLNTEVAIKVINQKYASQPDFIRRFECEATMVANLQCPYITPITNYWRDPDAAYIVMWYIRGGNLKESLKDGPFDVHRANRVLNQICAALSYAHRNGVIHRDVKPANILLDEEGNAFLSDFGIAKNLQQPDGHTNTGEVVGTVGYTAPEQIRGDSVSATTDIYSLGVILYEMLAGEHPFPDLNQVEQIYKSLNDPLPLLDGLDESIQDSINIIIQKATEKDPAKRYQDAIEMASNFRDSIASVTDISPHDIVESLTMREQEILKLIVERKTNRDIATALFITVGTVKWYINQIYKKLKVRNRVEAIVKARELNLIVDEPLTEDDNGHTVHTYVFLEEPDNPYKGLSAFTLADERDFYGRETITRKLLKRMRQETAYHRFLTIIGPSGSGKSSLVKAGLVPAVLRGELDGSQHWFVTDMIPGAHPVDELEIALMRVAADQSNSIGEQIRRDARGLVRVSQLLLPDDGSDLLIVIDQFEEVFTLVEDENARQQFLDLIYTAITDPRSRVRIVATLRADFYDRPLQYPGIGDLIRERMETILPLSAEELEQAIIKPAANVGVRYEEGVVARIISDINYQPGALPLLQFALTELFENRHDRTITGQAYEEIGGTIGALAKRADELFLALEEDGQVAARQMFLRLVTLGEGTEDTRRRTTREELLSVSNDSDLMDDVIDIFASYRLLALDHDPVTHLPTVEVAHEAILREWEMLRNWLNNSREDIKAERQLSETAYTWQQNSHDASYLISGSRLERFEAWAGETQLALTPSERAFLQASVTERERQLTEKRIQQNREVALKHRVQRVLVALVSVFFLATVFSGCMAIQTRDERDRAEQERNRANSAEQEARRQVSIGLAALAEKELEGANSERGVLLALEALEHYPYTPQAQAALAHSVDEYRSVQILDGGKSVTDLIANAAWSPDGERVAASGTRSPNTVIIWDVATGRELYSGNPHSVICDDVPIIYDLAWSPSGEQIVTDADDCGTVVWNASTGEPLVTISGYGSTVYDLAWSPDGTTILTGHEDGTATLWEASTGAERLTLKGHTGPIPDVAWSPDGRRIATASADGTVRLWDVQTGEEQMMLSGHVGLVQSVAWSPDSTRLVTGGDDGLPRVWDTASGETLFVLQGHMGAVNAIDWSTDGRWIASLSTQDATLKVWDAATGIFLYQIPGTTLAFGKFSPDGSQILTGAFRQFGRVFLWDSSVSVPKLIGHTVHQEYAAWSPDGTLIATSSLDRTSRIWDAATGQQLMILNSLSRYSDWSPDSTRLVTPTDILSSFIVWDVTTGEVLSTMSTSDYFLAPGARWSPDGLYIAGSVYDPNKPMPIFVWDVESGEVRATLQPADDICQQGWPEWSPDSSKIISTCLAFGEPGKNTPALIRDVATGDVLMILESDHGWTLHAVSSPDGSHILTTYEKGVAKIWDAESGESILSFAGHVGPVFGAAWSPNGTYVATGDSAGVIKIWDAETGVEIESFTVPGDVVNVNWSPDGQYIIITGSGLTEPIIKRVWLSTEELIEYAYDCCVTRELTPAEREQFGLPERQ